MVSEDNAGNVGVTSEPVCFSPEATDDFFDLYVEAGGGSGFCFVATTAYGDYDHEDVRQLRWFRDSVLARVPGGSWLISELVH